MFDEENHLTAIDSTQPAHQPSQSPKINVTVNNNQSAAEASKLLHELEDEATARVHEACCTRLSNLGIEFIHYEFSHLSLSVTFVYKLNETVRKCTVPLSTAHSQRHAPAELISLVLDDLGQQIARELFSEAISEDGRFISTLHNFIR